MLFYQENIVKAGSYSRLSREDGDKMESDSIRNQKDLISDYATQRGFRIVEEYVDDGYSGTNFDRPRFQKMMEDVKKGKINCIIVKDLSRLGRNYIETGRYLEKIFPFLKVRFIAINDHYDSADQTGDADQIVIPFKNLINDAYCRDISIKIRSQLDVKRKNGKFIGSFAAYGYLKDPADKNHLVIDEVAAEIVRTIFGLKINGFSSGRIADRLDEMKVAPPLEYKRMCGFNFNSGFRSGRKPKWSVVTINRILRDELYIGTMVQGKNRKINYKVKQSRPVDEANWIRVQDMHDAIIPIQVFEIVQRLCEIDTRTAPDAESVYTLSGFLRCGDCSQNMVRRTATKNGKKYYYYHCSTFKRGDGCTSHNISEEKLLTNVLTVMQNQIRLILQADRLLSAVDSVPQQQIGVRTIDSQIAAMVAEIERYKNLKARLYEDYVKQDISQDEFKQINGGFTEKLQTAERTKAELEEKKKTLLSRDRTRRPWIDTFKEYQNITELDRKTIVSIVECIVIFDTERIEIHFRYEDEIEQMLMMAASITSPNEEFEERRVKAV